MSNYTIVTVAEVENSFAGKGWPGAMRFLTKDLGNEQVAITHRLMPQYAGGKGGYGHKHKTQEEIVYVIRGELEVKLDDKVEVVKAGQVIRIAPEVVRSLWNEQPDEAEILIISIKLNLSKILASSDSPNERSSDFSAVDVVTTIPSSDKTTRSSPLDKSGAREVLRKSSKTDDVMEDTEVVKDFWPTD